MNSVFIQLIISRGNQEMPASIQAALGELISVPFIEIEPLKSPLMMQSLTSVAAIDFSIQTHYKLV